jgi:hypothetical protein
VFDVSCFEEAKPVGDECEILFLCNPDESFKFLSVPFFEQLLFLLMAKLKAD